MLFLLFLNVIVFSFLYFSLLRCLLLISRFVRGLSLSLSFVVYTIRNKEWLLPLDSKMRCLYSSNVFMVISSKFVFESWVANEAPYYFVMQPWFDLFVFIHIYFESYTTIFIEGILYVFYVYLVLLFYITVSFGAILYSGLWFFIGHGCFFLFGYLVLFIFFFFFSLSLYLIDRVFKTPVAGLVLLSREFLALEDEDLWVSSNIFYFDWQIQNSRDFQVPLKAKETRVFITLLKLFFDEPLRNLQYSVFASELTDFRNRQRFKYLEKKRFRELTQELTSKHKFRRFKKLRSGVLRSSGSSESRRTEYLLSKSAFFISKLQSENFFYKFLMKNLRFYGKVPTKKKRKKQWIELKTGIARRRVSKLRLQRRAVFSKRITSPGPILSISKVSRSQISSAIGQLQPQNLRNNFVKPHLIPRINLKDFIFGSGGGHQAYNQLPKIPRFRRFLWFSLPFYLSLTSCSSMIFYSVSDWRRLLIALTNSIRSKFLGIIFVLFEDSWAMASFYTRYYSPQQIGLIQFLKLNNLSFFPFPDNPEDIGEGLVSISQKQQIILQKPEPVINIKRSAFVKRKSKGGASKESGEQMQIKQGKKLKAYRKRLRRKRGTAKKNVLILRDRYTFSTNSNVANIRYPKLRVMHLYKMLEYFYFVLSHDFDFFEEATFSAKVAALRDKYGPAIVADLLAKNDHKQASKVSVVMHVTETSEIVKEIVNSKLQASDLLSDSTSVLPEATRRKQAFVVSSLTGSRLVSNFSRDLLLSYRFKFRF